MQIYAELSRKIQRLLNEGDCSLVFPVGVKVDYKRNGRSLMLECEEYMVDMVEELLESGGIPYQEMDDRDTQDDDDDKYDKYGYDRRGNKKKKKKSRPKW